MLFRVLLFGLLALLFPFELSWAKADQSGDSATAKLPPEWMVLIPAGKGIEWWDGIVFSHWIVKTPFLIDRFEVTVGEYREYLDPQPEIRRRDLSPAYIEQTDLLKHSRLPVVGVTWRQASLYCKSVGKRLPENVEWMMAALRKEDLKAGPGGIARFNKDTFGKERSSEKVILKRPYFVYEQGLQDVGSDKNDVSAYDVHDMGGSVSEWVEWTNIDFPTRKIFGRFSKSLGPNFFSATELEDHGGRFWLGFRCAKDFKE